MDEGKRLREELEAAAEGMTEKELRIVLAFIRGLLSNKACYFACWGKPQSPRSALRAGCAFFKC